MNDRGRKKWFRSQLLVSDNAALEVEPAGQSQCLAREEVESERGKKQD